MSCRFVALSLSFFVRETVETLRLSHISLSSTSSYKVSSKFQSFKVPSFFFFSIATYRHYLCSFIQPILFFCLFLFGLSLYKFACQFYATLSFLYKLVSFYLPCVFLCSKPLSKKHNPCFFLHSPCAFLFMFLLINFDARTYCSRTKNGNSID